MKLQLTFLVSLIGLVFFGATANAQTRDEKVRNDKKKVGADESWFYDDLDAGIDTAKKSGKPLMVVLRCIP